MIMNLAATQNMLKFGKECETVHKKVPVQVSNLVKKIVCHELDEVTDDVFDTADDVVDTIDVTVFDTNYDNYENNAVVYKLSVVKNRGGGQK